MTAAALPWQRSRWDSLRAMECDGRLPHALLLSGARGLGKRRLANILLRWLLCDEHLARETPCERCRGCDLAAAGSHPDLSRLEPEEGKTTISVDAVRSLIAYVQLTPSHNSRKLILVEEADRLSTGSANTLLKVLEEPPGAALFVLVADRPAALPVTVRSRCQQLRLRAPPPSEAHRWLAEQGVGEEAETLLEVAGHAPLRALQLARAEYLPQLMVVDEDVGRLLCGHEDPVRAARRWSKLPLPETIAAVANAIAREVRNNVAQQPDAAGHFNTLAIDSRRLFDALDECAQVRGLIERRTLSTNEQVMAAQRVALACALAASRA